MNTTTNAWPTQAQRTAFYGDPRGQNGRVNPKWEAENIARVAFPWDAVLAWDPRTRVQTIRIHHLCAASLTRILQAIWRAADGRQQVIQTWGMHLYGGGFEFRQVRGGTSLSSHSWGCAVDFDPARNALGDPTPNFEQIPEVLAAFDAEGWTWGGTWTRKDGMHWQATRVR